jgi:hypothetical protein
MISNLTPDEAMERINTIVAHAWMVRTFLKHAPEFEDDVDRMEIPRAIFDFARAVETRYATRDAVGYLKMVRKKLPKLRAAAERFSAERTTISNHTNFEQAAMSLSGCTRAIEEILSTVTGELDRKDGETSGPTGETPA